MGWIKRPLCWVTRHHWLLINDSEPSPFFTPEDRVYMYCYECQVCQKLTFEEVRHI